MRRTCFLHSLSKLRRIQYAEFSELRHIIDDLFSPRYDVLILQLRFGSFTLNYEAKYSILNVGDESEFANLRV